MAPRIEIAKNAGACYGVKRALSMALEAVQPNGVAHTLGPLIHNPRVVNDLAEKGIEVAETLDDVEEGVVILRSHGTAPAIVEEAERRGFIVVDATCPYVSTVQRKARELADLGYGVVIIGEPGHAEVEGIRAWGGEAVVAVADMPEKLPSKLPARVGVVIQTTQSSDRVNAVLAALGPLVEELRVEETVCFATQERQAAADELAGRADAMLVVGGRNSGNTRRLYEICKARCADTFHIESAEEIELDRLSNASLIGITAGASTPQEHIDSVCDHLRSAFDGESR